MLEVAVILVIILGALIVIAMGGMVSYFLFTREEVLCGGSCPMYEACINGTCTRTCGSNNQCGYGETCVFSVCTDQPLPAIGTCRLPGSKSGSHCPKGFTCYPVAGGTCLPDSSTSYACSTVSVQTMPVCPYTCVGEVCQYQELLPQQCSSATACPPNTTCVKGFCMPTSVGRILSPPSTPVSLAVIIGVQSYYLTSAGTVGQTPSSFTFQPTGTSFAGQPTYYIMASPTTYLSRTASGTITPNSVADVTSTWLFFPGAGLIADPSGRFVLSLTATYDKSTDPVTPVLSFNMVPYILPNPSMTWVWSS